MSENKNIQSLSARERIGVGLGAAAIGVMVAGGLSSDNSIERVEVSNETISQPYEQSNSDTSIILEPVHKNAVSELASNVPAPIFKGKVTIKKMATEEVETSITTPPVITEITIPEFLPNNGLIQNTLIQPNMDKAQLTESDYKYVSENTVYLDFNDGYCSGSLIRNAADMPVGVRTAQHCYLEDDSVTPRYQGTDGKTYIVKPSAVVAKIGSFKPDFKTFGTVNEFYLPNSKDRTMDIAIGAFQGHSMDEVLEAFKSTALSNEDINSIKAGSRATLSGYPALQKNNTNPDYLKRQDFPMVTLGVTKDSPTHENEKSHEWNIDILWTAVLESEDGASCSYGNSGGEGTIMIDGKRMSLGVLSRFIPLTTDFNRSSYSITPEQILAVKQNFENAFGIDLSGVVALCGFTNKIPDSNNPGTVAEVVSSEGDIPTDQETFTQELPDFAKELIQKAHDEFFDPNIVKTWVSGAINLDPNGKGYWKMNPAIFFDKESGGAVIATFTDNSKDGLELNYIADFKNQKFYGYPELHSISGELEVFTGMFGPDGFTSVDGGAVFGQNQTDPDAIRIIKESPTFSLYFDDATQSLQIMQNK